MTEAYPKSEIYGLTNQIRRCAVSIPSNIAQGAARSSNKEFAHFLSIAMGSIAELETQLIISKNLSFISNATFEQFVDELIIISRDFLLILCSNLTKMNGKF